MTSWRLYIGSSMVRLVGSCCEKCWKMKENTAMIISDIPYNSVLKILAARKSTCYQVQSYKVFIMDILDHSLLTLLYIQRNYQFDQCCFLLHRKGKIHSIYTISKKMYIYWIFQPYFLQVILDNKPVQSIMATTCVYSTSPAYLQWNHVMSMTGPQITVNDIRKVQVLQHSHFFNQCKNTQLLGF